MTARALAGMTSRMAYLALALDEGWDVERVEETITQLWLNALGVPWQGRHTCPSCHPLTPSEEK
jgi:hypothetical protein